MRLRVDHGLPLAALALFSGCLGGGHSPGTPVIAADAGPAADYPMVTGQPFTIGETLYRPEDRLNYDAVGRVALGEQGLAGVSIAHKTLPLPSYAEVTSLESGRTILVRVERRGPMSNDRLAELSPEAASQLGLIRDGAPIRLRRVNPPEMERALLRSGARAPERMETPKSLVAVLLRKLDGSPASLQSEPAVAAAEKPATAPVPVTASPASSAPVPRTGVQPNAPAGSIVVQAGAFSSESRARTVASRIGGHVETAGRLFRVRIGPFKTMEEARAALAKVKAAGYSGSQVQRI